MKWLPRENVKKKITSSVKCGKYPMRYGIVASWSVGIFYDISAIVDLFKVVFDLKYTWIYRYTLVGSKLDPTWKHWLGLYLNPLCWFYTDEYNQILVWLFSWFSTSSLIGFIVETTGKRWRGVILKFLR